jgi:hypothetical protein
MNSGKFKLVITATALLPVAMMFSTLGLAGGVWLRHNHRHFVQMKSTEAAATLGNAAGFVGSTFSGLSLLAVIYSLLLQDRQRRDDILRQSLLDMLKTLHETMPEGLADYTPEPVTETLSAAQRRATWETVVGKDIPSKASKFWREVAVSAEKAWGPSRLGKQRAMLIAINELSGKASLDERRLLRSISPAYLPVPYLTSIVCDAFVAKDLAAIGAIDAVGSLEECLSGYGGLASTVKHFLRAY